MTTKTFQLTSLLGVLFAALASVHADVSTVPVGFVNIAIKGSPDGIAPAVTQFSAPLQPIASITGAGTGRISSVTANSISNSAAAWSATALSGANAPYFVRITSGTAVGRIFNILSNTDNTLTVNSQGLNLTTAGIATGTNGDTYEIFPGYTLFSLLGTPTEGVIGGNTTQFAANQTDKVLINDSAGVARFYYYDTGSAQWRREGSGTNQNSLLVSPYSGLAYYRVSANPLSFTFIGKVPNTDARLLIPTSGTTLFASYFPVSTTLASLGFSSLSTWRKVGGSGVTLSDADRVLAEDAAGVLRSYYFDGTNWKREGSNSIQDATAIAAGTAIYCTRFGSGASETLGRTLPYNLNN